tara:strand:- start:220 stop:645 length:426 start_codon:yes stop_codon:yes gene_type:complete
MIEKTPYYLIPVITMALISEFIGLSLLVTSITLIDMLMGLYIVYKFEDCYFSLMRLMEGFFKIILYSVAIFISYLISSLIIQGNLFEIKHLIPKVITMIFVTLEVKSIDRKRVKLGEAPILQTIRASIKIVKEFYNYKKSK